MVLPSPSREPVGISKLIPLKEGSICGTGGSSSVLSFRSNSADLFFRPPHLRSDHRDPGRDPGRELGRGPDSLTRILGTLHKEGGPPLVAGRMSSERSERLSSPVGVDGVNPPSFLFRHEREVEGRLWAVGDAALVLSERPLGSGGVLAGADSETDRIAGGLELSTDTRIGRDSDRTGDNAEGSSTIIPA